MKGGIKMKTKYYKKKGYMMKVPGRKMKVRVAPQLVKKPKR